MRAKELKQFLNNIPDDTEILLRCQVHEVVPVGMKESIKITSVTPHINETTHEVTLNAERNVRLAAFEPAPTELVSCETCVRANRIKTCKQRGRKCETCTAVCECKNCNYFNTTSMQPFSSKPKYERDVHAPNRSPLH